MTAEEVAAVIIAREMRKEQVVKRAKSIAATPIQQTPDRRRIPDDVKLLVWRRDEGRCVKCGSTTELQYDHIIPVSLGGGSSPENVELLCGPCNRRKGNSIT